MPFTPFPSAFRTILFGSTLFVVALEVGASPLPYLDDPGLQACLEQHSELNNWSQAEQVTQLECVGRGVEMLNGIEQLPNLIHLNVAENALADITVLGASWTPRLTFLDISDNPLVMANDLAWVLQYQQNLTYLGLAGLDLAGFSSWGLLPPELLGLNAANTNLSNDPSTPFIAFPEMISSLNLADNALDYVDFAAQLPNLRELNVARNNITSLYPLTMISQLESLDVSANPLPDDWELRNVLAQQSNLQSLSVADLRVTSDTLMQIPNPMALQSLDVSGTDLGAGNWLGTFVGLQRLVADRTKLKDVYFLQNLGQLRELSLADNAIEDFPDFPFVSALESLNLAGNHLYALNFQVGSNTLKHLDLGGNTELPSVQVSALLGALNIIESLGVAGLLDSYSALDSLPNPDRITYLDISDIQTDSYVDVQRFQNLKTLKAQNSNLKDIFGLQNLLFLQSLYLANNQLEYLPGNWQSRSLRELDLSHNKLMDLWPLQNLRGLTLLSLADNVNLNGADIAQILQSNGALRSLDLSGLDFEWASLNQLSRPELLTSLRLANCGLSFLGPLSNFYGLQELDVSGNHLQEIYDLQFMQQLRSLNIANNAIYDWYANNQVFNLRYLNVSNNPIWDFNALQQFVAAQTRLESLLADGIEIPPSQFYQFQDSFLLRELSVAGSQLEVLPSLWQMPNLERLNLANNHILFLDGLMALTNLREFNIANNGLIYLSSLPEEAPLTLLNLANNRGIDFNQFFLNNSNIRYLKQLNLAGLGLTSLYELPLPELSGLTVLDLSDNRLMDLDGVQMLTSLQTLVVDNNRIKELWPLSQSTRLSELSARNNRVTYIEGLPYYNLTSLNLLGNMVEYLGQLEQFHKLTKLALTAAPMGSFGSVNAILNDHPGWRELRLQGFAIASIDELPLPMLRDLEVLEIANAGMLQLDRLVELDRLRVLELPNNNLLDVYFVGQLQGLQTLNLENNQITGLNGGNGLDRLQVLKLSGNVNLSLVEINNLLANAPLLNTLSLSDMDVFDLSAFNFVNPQAMRELSVVNSGLNYLAGVERFSRLEGLNVSYNDLQDVYWINNLHNLKSLDLSNNSQTLNDIPLNSLRFMENLQLNELSFFSPENILAQIAGLPHLKHLGVAGIPIADLYTFNLANPEQLLTLNLTGSLESSADVGVLGDFAQLRELNLSHNGLTDLYSLNDLFNLERLDLSDNTVGDVSWLIMMAQNQILGYVNLLNNGQIPCEQLDQLASIPTLQLQRPEDCLKGTPPELAVFAPMSGQVFEAGELLQLSANASDWEDGGLHADISWTSSLDGFLGVGANLSVLLSGGSHVISVAVTDSDGNRVAEDIPITVNTTTNYCAAKGSSTRYEWIESLLLNGVNVATGNNNGYLDSTGVLLTATSGINQLQLNPGYGYGSYSENWAVWIDLNRDGNFSAGEKMVAAYGSGLQSSYFTIPMGVAAGEARMRVVMSWGAAPVPCGNFNFGEVEDYSILLP